jgi:hypothetical protein
MLLTPLLAHSANWFTGNFEAAKAQAQQENKQILIDFYSDG